MMVKAVLLILCMYWFSYVKGDQNVIIRGQAMGIQQWRNGTLRSTFESLDTNIAEAEQDVKKQNEWWVTDIPVRKDEDYATASAHIPGCVDLISTGLPGQPEGDSSQNFSQYGGYVTVDEKAGRALFYYFAEAIPSTGKNSYPSDVPLILWLNGGPGCSSLGYGAFEELGPWHVNNDSSSLRFNPFAWNTIANVMFLESPAGVGFSYSNRSSDYDNAGDTPTALDAYAFLINWFQRFPQYQNHIFYIAGESYAVINDAPITSCDDPMLTGHYVPQLAQTIVAHKDKGYATFINLKGILVGNGLIHTPTDIEGMYTYPWTHALISDRTYQDLMQHCLNQPHHQCGDYTDNMNIEMDNIDIYSIYAPSCMDSPPSSFQDQSYMIPGYDPCLREYVESYLNKKDVQKALHANTTGILESWKSCSSLAWTWNYTGDSPQSMLPILQNLMMKKYKILIYSGDIDGAVPVTSTKGSLKLLNLTITSSWRAWSVDGQVGGYIEEYDGLTFSTVRGAGHEVPLFQPSRMLALLQKFLRS